MYTLEHTGLITTHEWLKVDQLYVRGVNVAVQKRDGLRVVGGESKKTGGVIRVVHCNTETSLQPNSDQSWKLGHWQFYL